MRKTPVSTAVFLAITHQRQAAQNAQILRDVQHTLREMELERPTLMQMARRPGKTKMHRLWMKIRGLL